METGREATGRVGEAEIAAETVVGAGLIAIAGARADVEAPGHDRRNIDAPWTRRPWSGPGIGSRCS